MNYHKSSFCLGCGASLDHLRIASPWVTNFENKRRKKHQHEGKFHEFPPQGCVYKESNTIRYYFVAI